jgi:hypothetical protein
MTELAVMVSRFGLPTVVGMAIVFLLIKGEVSFKYPRKK